MDSGPEALRVWISQRRLAEAREKAALRDNAPDPASALRRGLALIDFAAKARGSTPTAPGALAAEDLRAYRRWAAVRNALRAA